MNYESALGQVLGAQLHVLQTCRLRSRPPPCAKKQRRWIRSMQTLMVDRLLREPEKLQQQRGRSVVRTQIACHGSRRRLSPPPERATRVAQSVRTLATKPIARKGDSIWEISLASCSEKGLVQLQPWGLSRSQRESDCEPETPTTADHDSIGSEDSSFTFDDTSACESPPFLPIACEHNIGLEKHLRRLPADAQSGDDNGTPLRARFVPASPSLLGPTIGDIDTLDTQGATRMFNERVAATGRTCEPARAQSPERSPELPPSRQSLDLSQVKGVIRVLERQRQEEVRAGASVTSYVVHL